MLSEYELIRVYFNIPAGAQSVTQNAHKCNFYSLI